MPDARRSETTEDLTPETRHIPDRRRRPTPMLSRYLFRGRRRGGRRTGEGERIYVDWPGGWIIAACVALVALSIADAYVTLVIIADGGEEINPLMRAVLALGHGPFLVVKVGLTLAGAIVLCLHKTWPLGRLCLWIALGGYGALLAYHLVIHMARIWAE